MKKKTLRILALPTVLAASVALAACGSSTSMPNHNADQMKGMATTAAPPAAGAPATGAKSSADVKFATDMIPHHTQAVAMAAMAPKQAADPKVKALAAKVKSAQDPEIARMSGWLTGWGAPVPAAAGGHDMAAMGATMNGMMSDQEMTALGKATGSAFDRMWLQAMTKHHQGAVAMARTEIATGTNPDAKKLAQAVVDSQSAEITEMRSILTAIPG